MAYHTDQQCTKLFGYFLTKFEFQGNNFQKSDNIHRLDIQTHFLVVGQLQSCLNVPFLIAVQHLKHHVITQQGKYIGYLDKCLVISNIYEFYNWNWRQNSITHSIILVLQLYYMIPYPWDNWLFVQMNNVETCIDCHYLAGHMETNQSNRQQLAHIFAPAEMLFSLRLPAHTMVLLELPLLKTETLCTSNLKIKTKQHR